MNDQINYDKNAIEQNIDYFNNILEQQIHLQKVLENNSIAQIEKTTRLIDSMTPIVNQHHQIIQNLDSQIRNIISNNKNNLKDDHKFQNFLKTKLCTDFSKKINEIDTLVFNLKKLLKKEGIELLPKN